MGYWNSTFEGYRYCDTLFVYGTQIDIEVRDEKNVCFTCFNVPFNYEGKPYFWVSCLKRDDITAKWEEEKPGYILISEALPVWHSDKLRIGDKITDTVLQSAISSLVLPHIHQWALDNEDVMLAVGTHKLRHDIQHANQCIENSLANIKKQQTRLKTLEGQLDAMPPTSVKMPE